MLRTRLSILALVAIASLTSTASASAAVFFVTTNADTGPGSLRAAAATFTGLGDIVDMSAISGQTITLGSPISVSSGGQVSIEGAGVTLDGDYSYALLEVIDGDVTIDHALLSNGRGGDGTDGANTAGMNGAGGGSAGQSPIMVSPGASLTLSNVDSYGNVGGRGGNGGNTSGLGAAGGGGGGGAVFMNAGTMTVVNSSLSSNWGGSGGSGGGGGLCSGGGGGAGAGAITNMAGATLTIRNSTIYDSIGGMGGDGGSPDQAAAGGGGGAGAGAIVNLEGGTLDILNSTVASNFSDLGGAGGSSPTSPGGPNDCSGAGGGGPGGGGGGGGAFDNISSGGTGGSGAFPGNDGGDGSDGSVMATVGQGAGGGGSASHDAGPGVHVGAAGGPAGGGAGGSVFGSAGALGGGGAGNSGGGVTGGGGGGGFGGGGGGSTDANSPNGGIPFGGDGGALYADGTDSSAGGGGGGAGGSMVTSSGYSGGAGTYGSSALVAAGTVTMSSTILARSGDRVGTFGYNDCRGTITTGTANLLQDATGCTRPVGDTLTGDPQLDSPGPNGGSTHTMPIANTSPALDAGANPLSLADDQRGTGFNRSEGPQTDIGAYEIPYYDVTVKNSLSPVSDPGRFDLLVGATTVFAGAAHNDQGTLSVIDDTTITASEVAHAGTSLADYTPTFNCGGIGSGAGTSKSLSHIHADVTCTFTNTKIVIPPPPTPPTPPPADHTAPLATVALPSGARVRKGKVLVRLGCPATEVSCRFEVFLSSSFTRPGAHAKVAQAVIRHLIVRKDVTVPGGQTVDVPLTLTAKARRALAKGPISALLRVSASDVTGNHLRLKRRITLRND